MLPASERLRRASVFQRAYTGRKSISTEYFTLYILLRQRKLQGQLKTGQGVQESDLTRERAGQRLETDAAEGRQGGKKCRQWRPLVGFVVSKKVIKGACQRNRVKRRMREAYRSLRSGEKEEKSVSSGELRDVSRSLQQWYALVWVINEKVLNANWEEICKKMEESLLQASRRYGEKGAHEERRPGR